MGHKPKKFTLEGKAVYDEKTGQLVYRASLFEWVSGIALFLFILGMTVFYMVFDGFNATTRMPWG